MLRNTPIHYGILAKTLHWLMAALIIGMVVFGFVLDGMERSPQKIAGIGIHKSIGIALLIFAVTRLLWRMTNPRVLLSEAARWQQATAHAVHGLLYIAMLMMPVSGWGMSSAAGYPVSFFGLFTLPPLVEKSDEWGGFFREAHELLAFMIIGLVAVHVMAALYHHFIQKDKTLHRMLRG